MQEGGRVGDRTATAEERCYDHEESESAYRFKQTCTPIGACRTCFGLFQKGFFLPLEEFRLSFGRHGDTGALDRQRPDESVHAVS